VLGRYREADDPRPNGPVASDVQISLNVKIPQHGDNQFVRFTEQMSKEITT